MNLFEGLNTAQQQAASHIEGAMLILAGAGSGKTKTITTRLAYLIDEVGIPASQTLTLTFTNKAAKVMKNRALALVKNHNTSQPLLCTFHKFGLLFLRLHIERLYRKNNFIVIDSEDKKSIIKTLMNDSIKSSPALIAAQITHFKNELQSVEALLHQVDFLKSENKNFADFQALVNIYRLYENFLQQNNLVDFDDLLLLTYQILSSDELFCKEQSQFYQYIMVDEYQDTNSLQYQFLKQLCSTHQNIVVVGDDDQSIYTWRGAKIENILNFQKYFENTKIVKLEHNYRSSSKILQAANALIKQNKTRLGKTLIPTKAEGEDIVILEHNDEKEEALALAKAIEKLIKQGVAANEIAVLYRVNALSRSLEESFMRLKLAFKILSGMRFYERAEIKDMLSYLRLVANLNDDFSFKRIINRPKRAFGKAALQKLEDFAKKHKISLFQALCNVQGSGFFKEKLDKEMREFITKIENLREYDNLYSLFSAFEQSFNFKEYYKYQSEGEERLQNIDEFFASLKEKAKSGEYQNLEDILNELSLLSEQDELEGACVYLMSIHASKGLEFDYVFIVGLEEGFFPLLNENSDIEEERRLAYVAITRAKKALILSWAHSRFFRASRTILEKSRFLKELKNEKEVLDKEFKKGDLIKHKIFGIGRVIALSKENKALKLSINFGGIQRTLLADFVEKIL